MTINNQLQQAYRNTVDGYYDGSEDYHWLMNILEEVDFLYSRGILKEKNLGRFIDIIEDRGKTKSYFDG